MNNWGKEAQEVYNSPKNFFFNQMGSNKTKQVLDRQLHQVPCQSRWWENPPKVLG